MQKCEKIAKKKNKSAKKWILEAVFAKIIADFIVWRVEKWRV